MAPCAHTRKIIQAPLFHLKINRDEHHKPVIMIAGCLGVGGWSHMYKKHQKHQKNET